MEWQDIPDGMPVYSIQGGPLDAEDNEPVLVATDKGRVFLVVPERDLPGSIRFQIFMAGWWLEEETEGKPVKWARVPIPAGLVVPARKSKPARLPPAPKKVREK